jgi:hypothetical protein
VFSVQAVISGGLLDSIRIFNVCLLFVRLFFVTVHRKNKSSLRFVTQFACQTELPNFKLHLILALGAFSSSHLSRVILSLFTSKMLFASNYLKKLNKKVCLLLSSLRSPLKKLAVVCFGVFKQNKLVGIFIHTFHPFILENSLL